MGPSVTLDQALPSSFLRVLLALHPSADRKSSANKIFSFFPLSSLQPLQMDLHLLRDLVGDVVQRVPVGQHRRRALVQQQAERGQLLS